MEAKINQSSHLIQHIKSIPIHKVFHLTYEPNLTIDSRHTRVSEANPSGNKILKTFHPITKYDYLLVTWQSQQRTFFHFRISARCKARTTSILPL